MERIDVNPDGADVCLRTGRLSNLVPELREQLARNPWEAGIMGDPNLSCDRCTLTVRVPISIPRRDGRKLVLAPDGTIDTLAPPSRRIDDAMVKAIARAFRWRGMLENGTHATIAEIAAAEKINESYVGRVLRLTLLAPDIVEAILAGRQLADLQLDRLMKRFPVGWQAQRDAFSLTS